MDCGSGTCVELTVMYINAMKSYHSLTNDPEVCLKTESTFKSVDKTQIVNLLRQDKAM